MGGMGVEERVAIIESLLQQYSSPGRRARPPSKTTLNSVYPAYDHSASEARIPAAR